jgi:FlaA1/EpsC-like NDP-sugar epimerase
MLRRFSVNFAIFSMLVDAILVGVTLWFTAMIRPEMSRLPFIAAMPEPVVLPGALYFVFPLVWVIIFSSFSIYDGKKYLRVTAEFAALSWASCITAISLAGILYILYRDFSRAQFFLFVVLTYFSFLLWRGITRLLFRLRSEHPATARKIVIVGAGPIGQMVEQRLREYQDTGRSIVGYVDSDPPDSFLGELIGPISNLKSIVEGKSITDVIIALPPNFFEQTSLAVEQLSEEPVKVWLVPGSFTLGLITPTIEEIEGLPLLNLRASAINEFERLVKRVFDIVIGLFLLILTSPILCLSAIAIWLEDRGQVLFRQKRIGENGSVFTMLKFRTMIPEAERLQEAIQKTDGEGNIIHKTRDDPRITHVGRAP